jgi:acetyl esterase/lipase
LSGWNKTVIHQVTASNPASLPVSTSVCTVISYYGPTDLQAQFERFSELPTLTGKGWVERTFMGYLRIRTGFEVIPVHELIPGLLGGSPLDVPETYDLVSPVKLISENCPPTRLLQGKHDFSGVVPQVVQLHKTLLQSGVISYLFELPGTEHGFDLYRPKWSPAAQSATFVTERFLGSFS